MPAPVPFKTLPVLAFNPNTLWRKIKIPATIYFKEAPIWWGMRHRTFMKPLRRTGSKHLLPMDFRSEPIIQSTRIQKITATSLSTSPMVVQQPLFTARWAPMAANLSMMPTVRSVSPAQRPLSIAMRPASCPIISESVTCWCTTTAATSLHSSTAALPPRSSRSKTKTAAPRPQRQQERLWVYIALTPCFPTGNRRPKMGTSPNPPKMMLIPLWIW